MQGDQLDLLGTLPASATQLDSSAALLQLLDDWLANGWLRALDRAFAGFLLEQAPETSPAVLLAAALVSHQLGHGHVCLDLAATRAEPDFALSLPPEGESLRGTAARVLAAYVHVLLPAAMAGGTTLVVSQGNTLRALCMALDGLDAAAIESFDLSTGATIHYAIGETTAIVRRALLA